MHKKIPTVLFTREMQTKTTMRYHIILVRMAIIKKSTSNNGEEGVEKRESFYTVGGNENWCSHYEKQYGGSFKRVTLPYDPTILLLNIYSEEKNLDNKFSMDPPNQGYFNFQVNFCLAFLKCIWSRDLYANFCFSCSSPSEDELHWHLSILCIL